MLRHSAHCNGLLVALSLCSFVACSGDAEPEPSDFTLAFAAQAVGVDVSCESELENFGPQREHHVRLADLRFYVSNLQFSDREGRAVAIELDENDYQYTGKAGSVALIDLTGNDSGGCTGSAMAFSEGTARTNFAVTGRAIIQSVSAVSFDVGVPQALMQEVIGSHSAESAPSPLNEMQWTWASGYRHFVLNFSVRDRDGETGDGSAHVGSRDCGPADGLALEDRDACTFVNTPKVSLPEFDLARDRVVLDLPKLLAGLDFVSNVYDPQTFEALGEGPGVECHSSPSQPDCATLFGNLGIDADDGSADASRNRAFGRE